MEAINRTPRYSDDREVIASAKRLAAKQHIGMMNHYYREADAYAKLGKLDRAAQCLDAAEKSRIHARNNGAKV